MLNRILLVLLLATDCTMFAQLGFAQSGNANLNTPGPGQSNSYDEGGDYGNTPNEASSSVPLDSWIYPAFDRLVALGYVQSSSAFMRPWTRLECARLLAEAHGNQANVTDPDETTLRMFSALDAEFAYETAVMSGAKNTSGQVEDAYGRYTELSGTPLRDSFHFAQTLSDDFGRPYGKGSNGISGLSLRADAGFLSVYFHGEYQYASTLPAYNAVAQQTITNYDRIPYDWDLRTGITNRPRSIEAYAAINFANWQLSLGQQGLWWGPDKSTSLMLSNNAEPLPMLRLSRSKPIKMPGLLRRVGPVHVDAFFAREGGIHYVALGSAYTVYGSASTPLNPPPYIWAVAFSVKPTTNFELGFAHTTIFAGYGRPLTWGTFFHTFSGVGNLQGVDPGKRVIGFNLSYRVGPKRDTTIYSELFAYDNPIAGRILSVYALDPGIYVARVPKLNKLDLRMEGVYTNLPGQHGQAYDYSNAHYLEGYTSYGQILGSWVGRQGDGGQVTSSYWFSARNKASISYRKMSADKSFLQGGNLDNVSASVTWMPKQEIEVSATGQFEQWKFPLLYTTGKSDFATIFEIRTYPKIRLGSR